MQNYLNSDSDNETNIQELFLLLWANKLLITFTCAVGILLGGYYAINTDKKYTSSATFKLNSATSAGIPITGEMGLLANIAGFNGGTESIISASQINGRIFIKKIDAKLDLQTDPYFNSYNSTKKVDPIWKSFIKRTIGWQQPTTNFEETIWQGITNKYSQNIFLNETDDGAFKIVVKHEDAVRAADIANAVMIEIISYKKVMKDSQQDKQLFYLSNTLAKALSELEIAQSNLKSFALENTAVPLESFAAESLKLEILREQFSRTTELYEAVSELSLMLKNGTTGQTDYLSLRQAYPIVDQVEFRRVLGQNEIISSWSWPELSSVTTVFDTLSERINRLQSQINMSEIDAERSSQALEVYGQLEREEKVAQATYTVLIEQVKSQSMAAGYRPTTSEIYEYAYPSIHPTEPNLRLSVMLGSVLGLLLGSVLAFVIAMKRDVYYSIKTLSAGVQARLNASNKTIRSLRNKSLFEANKQIKKKPKPVLRDISVEIHKGAAAQTVVTSSRAKMTSYEVAVALALTMQSDNINIAIINFSEKSQKLNLNNTQSSVGSFVVVEIEGKVSVLKPEANVKAIELVSQKDFLKNIQSLDSNFDLIFLCADDGDAISLLRALEGQQMFHLTIARTKYTKSDTLLTMSSLLQIQGLLHD